VQARWPDLLPQLAELSEDQWRDLFETTRGQFGANPKALAQMENVYTRALLHPESGRVTAGLSAVYLTVILLGIATASVSHLSEDAGR
jgi:hypothetical protein